MYSNKNIYITYHVFRLSVVTYIDMGCTSPDQIHPESGLCFGVDTTSYSRTWADARATCRSVYSAGLVAPNTLSKWDFISTSPIFDSQP